MADFLTPFGGMGWGIPGKRGRPLPQAPREKLKAFLGLPDLPLSREGYPLFLKRQREERAEESL